MNWHELQIDWQQREEDRGADFSPAPPPAMARLWSQVRRRDFLETGLAVLMLPFFAVATAVFVSKALWVSAGFLGLVTAGIAMIPWQLWRSRRLRPATDSTSTVLDHLRLELRALQAQQVQAQWAFVWYFLPIGIGVTGFYVSVAGVGRDSLIYAAVVLGVGVGIDWLNRVWAARKFQQAVEVIRAQIAELEVER